MGSIQEQEREREAEAEVAEARQIPVAVGISAQGALLEVGTETECEQVPEEAQW